MCSPDDGTTRLDIAGILRTLRRRADLSQRELAARSRLPRGTLGSIESGTARNPSLRTVERLVAAAGARLVVLDMDGAEPVPDHDPRRDRGPRRFPAHLDVQPRAEPPGRLRRPRAASGFTFLRNRRRRDLARARDEHQRAGLTYDVRLLGPGDRLTLAAWEAGVAECDLEAGTAGAGPAAPDRLGYLRDPCLRHWVAQERGLLDPAVRGHVLAHLVARLHRTATGSPHLLLVDFAARPGAQDELAGIMLVATMSDEAVRLRVERVVSAVDDPVAVAALRRLGFRHGRRSGALILSC